MKTYISLLLLALLSGCGDNSVTNNPTNPGTSDTTELFFKDSVYVDTTVARDSVEFASSVSIDTLHISWTFSSQNVNSVFITTHTKDTILEMLPAHYTKDYHFQFPVGSVFTSKTQLQLMGTLNSPYYASLKNIRLYYVR